MSKPKPKWKFDPDNWPDQRESFAWNNLNRGQKNYVINAYNKARYARGLKPIPNPFGKDKGKVPIIQNESGVETITPETVGRAKISPLNRLQLNKFIQAIPPGQKGPLLEMFNNQSTLSPMEQLMRADPQLRHVIENFDFNDFDDDQAGFSGTKKQKTDHQESGKRKLEEVEEEEEETQAKRPPTEADMTKLPGTGRNTDDDAAMDTGTPLGKGGSSGGFATATGPITTVARPLNYSNSGGLVFEKVHRLLSYGLASVSIDHELNTNAATTSPIVLVTTSLMEIPWDRPFFYLSPGELDSLPKGSFVKSVHIEVVQRNPRVAFETAASGSGLATLNQNKFGIKAIGLNSLNGMRVTSRRYTAFNASEPMIPTTTTVSKYDDIDTAMYGQKQSSASFDKAIPSTCFMVPIHIPNYLTCWNNGHDLEITDGQDTGWYSLAEHVTQFDMQATAGTKIIDASYKPSYAPLKEQTQYAEYLRGQLGPVSASGIGGINFNAFTYTDGDTTKQVTKITINDLNSAANSNPIEDYTTADTVKSGFTAGSRYRILERGQLSKTIDRGDNAKCMQPSIHVGISPVPKLTSTTNVITPINWTDVQAYYEIKATMHVGYNFPHHNTYQSEFNIEANEVKMGVLNEAIDTAYPARFGKYHQYQET